MIVKNYIEKNNLPIDFNVYATDISSPVLKYANTGIYDKHRIKTQISEKFQAEYFEDFDTAKSIIKPELKKHLHFEFNSLVNGWYLNNYNIIICRNVFIYFNHTLQNQILDNFIYSLKSGGMLCLGKSENINAKYNYIFDKINLKLKLFTKK